LGDNINITKKIREVLTNASEEVGLEVNTGKTKNNSMSRHQNTGTNHNTDVGKFKYFGTTVSNKNSIDEEIKSRSNSGNDCYHSVKKRLSSHLLSNT
jgi:hypothetical protein